MAVFSSAKESISMFLDLAVFIAVSLIVASIALMVIEFFQE